MKKGEFQISSLLISLVIVVGFTAVIWGFASNLMINNAVAVPAQYNESFQTIINQTNDLNNVRDDLKAQTFQDNTNVTQTWFQQIANIPDVIGAYFSQGTKIIRLSLSSVDTMTVMTDTLQDSNSNVLGSSGSVLQYIIISLLLLAIAWLIIQAFIKWPV